MKNFTLKSN